MRDESRKWIILLVLVLGIGGQIAGFSEEEKKGPEPKDYFKSQTITTKEWLKFRVPEDMPIEKRDGILAPIPFDEYIYGKFEQVNDKLKSLESKIDELQKLLLSIKQEKETKSENEVVPQSVNETT